MQYSLRWIFAISVSVFIFLSGVIIFIRPDWQVLVMKQQEQKILQQKLDLLPSVSPMPNTHSAIKPFHTAVDIAMVAAKHIITINKLKYTGSREFQLKAEGDYIHIVNFISQLEPNISFNSWIVEPTVQGEMRLTADMAFAYNGFKSLNKDMPSSYSNNPFCELRNSLFDADHTIKEKLTQVSITDIKLVACLKQPLHEVAWLLLPDQTTCDVRLGDNVGREQAHVIAIDNQSITLKTTDNNKIIMRM